MSGAVYLVKKIILMQERHKPDGFTWADFGLNDQMTAILSRLEFAHIIETASIQWWVKDLLQRRYDLLLWIQTQSMLRASKTPPRNNSRFLPQEEPNSSGSEDERTPSPSFVAPGWNTTLYQALPIWGFDSWVQERRIGGFVSCGPGDFSHVAIASYWLPDVAMAQLYRDILNETGVLPFVKVCQMTISKELLEDTELLKPLCLMPTEAGSKASKIWSRVIKECRRGLILSQETHRITGGHKAIIGPICKAAEHVITQASIESMNPMDHSYPLPKPKPDGRGYAIQYAFIDQGLYDVWHHPATKLEMTDY